MELPIDKRRWCCMKPDIHFHTDTTSEMTTHHVGPHAALLPHIPNQNPVSKVPETLTVTYALH